MNPFVTLSMTSLVLTGMVFSGTSMAADEVARPVETQAVQALSRMSNHLNSLKQFEVQSDIDTDYLSSDGQIVTKTRQVTLRTRLPDGLYASVSHPARQRDFYFNGKQVTLYAPTKGYYATADAPAATVRELMDGLTARYGIDIPLSDLFAWSRDGGSIAEFQAARYAGAAVIDGRVCDQYAYRSQGAQWQLWIERSETPVPCRLSIANDEDQADRLRTTITYHWNTAARFTPSQFVFKPPKGAMKINLATVQAE
ncbi:DUF2092 domain-containing protein [Ottowia sp.]|uniref:DUF2092 domain-containing protein n=1 Tax=Ottowia sp. TaxID=1898956 RepID=UPI003A856E08